MSRRNLKSMALQFRNSMLGKHESGRMCFVICAPLAAYLQFAGVDCDVIEGEFEGSHHCWIRLTSGEIIDPTADQFNDVWRHMPKVFVGDLPAGYSESKGEQ